MITVQVEKLVDCLEELKPLFQPHWRELALNQEQVPLDPKYEWYLQMDLTGRVLCVVARERGHIVGYFIGFIDTHHHYRSTLHLTEDIFWLHPDFRDKDSLTMLEGDMLAQALFERVKLEAVTRGVKRAYLGSKVHRSAQEMFRQMGGVEADLYFSFWWGG